MSYLAAGFDSPARFAEAGGGRCLAVVPRVWSVANGKYYEDNVGTVGNGDNIPRQHTVTV